MVQAANDGTADLVQPNPGIERKINALLIGGAGGFIGGSHAQGMQALCKHMSWPLTLTMVHEGECTQVISDEIKEEKPCED